MFSSDLWSNTFGKVFEDGCPTSRNAELLRSKREQEKQRKLKNKSSRSYVSVSKNPFQVPGLTDYGIIQNLSQADVFSSLSSNGEPKRIERMIQNGELTEKDILEMEDDTYSGLCNASYKRKKKTSRTSYFIERINYKSKQSGEINNILLENYGKEGIINTTLDDSWVYNKKNSSSSSSSTLTHVTSEVRTREFVTRQLTGIGSTPQKAQATFMMMAAMVLAPVVAGDDWKDIGPNLCQEMGWPLDYPTKILLISAPRRFGKTRTVSMMVINYALSVPNTIVMVYSTSQDTSNLLRQDVEQCLKDAGELEFAGRRIRLMDLKGKYGERQLHLESPYKKGVYSVIYFCPGITKQNQDRFGYNYVFFIYFLFRGFIPPNLYFF